jgi:hypothetical protein
VVGIKGEERQREDPLCRIMQNKWVSGKMGMNHGTFFEGRRMVEQIVPYIPQIRAGRVTCNPRPAKILERLPRSPFDRQLFHHWILKGR